MMKNNQPTVFKMSSCVIFCGKLEDIFPHDFDQLKKFVTNQWERITKQQWQDSWFPPSKETQPNDTTRAIKYDAATDNRKKSRREPRGQGDQESSLKTGQTGNEDRSTNGHESGQGNPHQVDSATDNKAESRREPRGQGDQESSLKTGQTGNADRSTNVHESWQGNPHQVDSVSQIAFAFYTRQQAIYVV
ncbi:uncharacterized protein LOC115927364 [Strongylocentrotus purpuratus]|uniref:Uncharacterized protein n=1 Tax=Strongylocentrotus purpuratus TaxID=7668 RepID=A0A7M7PE68_STRPU|nr:uncharacterized protein LOC115927364 [Strongylocentrotus purpuratus]